MELNQTIEQFLLKIKPIKYYIEGKNKHLDPIYIQGKNKHRDPYYISGKTFLTDVNFLKAKELSILEQSKSPSRTEIINFLLARAGTKSNYLEIGVRNPEDNFNFIIAENKFSVDPGLEYTSNPVDFPMTSDEFFQKLGNNEILRSDIKFDVIFIDGMHLAEQVDRDIANSLKYIKDDGFVVLHDCNPPTEWHAREQYEYFLTPAEGYWNGTTWKAFLKWRFNSSINSCCINTDWGIGVLSMNQEIGKSIEPVNSFFEFNELSNNRNKHLNLIDFETFKKLIQQHTSI